MGDGSGTSCDCDLRSVKSWNSSSLIEYDHHRFFPEIHLMETEPLTAPRLHLPPLVCALKPARRWNHFQNHFGSAARPPPAPPAGVQVGIQKQGGHVCSDSAAGTQEEHQLQLPASQVFYKQVCLAECTNPLLFHVSL